MISIVAALWNCAPVQAAADPTTAKAYQQSYELEAKGEFAEAIKALKQVDAKEKTSYFFLLRYAWLHRCGQRYRVSAMYYRMAAQKIPHSIEALQGKLQSEVVRGKWDDVTKTALDLLRLDPKSYTGRFNLAQAYYFLERFPIAERLYLSIIRDYPGDLSARSGLGWSQLKQGRTAEAVRSFRTILQVCPSHALAKKGLEAAEAFKTAGR